ncbi:bifunctional hydroxymethylpyrimidine kinase/phosphomethylpyrimidine kinase [Actibacterium pelagium]|uniref:hydroxymethylpyrimidine kinase n=1 Tax=Actibacterium pelagium TaxID=2029103 RepID=A0A917AHY9_9RHOB|nr:bifunctional hydroxymethylpyrimidine kinase/phosphomethylpyrimidine kinase [Actibacterium pelagium]GGE52482.1 hydroxymethylpyrimidine/phosphomethylpyrimidine kinase [Actibacterium pelagium]
MTAIALTIAGSDSGGGAGIQADLKAMSALGAYGASVITAITAQNTQAVTAVHGVPLDVITAQIDAVLSDLDVDAIKIGMLATPEIIETVAEALKDYQGPIVLDPVMVAKSGDSLLQDDAVEALIRHLVPRAALLTPNLPEAARLLGQPEAETIEEMEKQGAALRELGAASVLMKGGHGRGDFCEDLLVTATGMMGLSSPRVKTKNTHGTGCTLSAAIAAGLAKGLDMETSVEEAHRYLRRAIREADTLTVGRGHGPVHHFHGIWAKNG